MSWYMMQSSTNNLVLALTQSGRYVMNNKKRSGPSTVPWGTPLTTGALSDTEPSTMTCWLLSDRNDLIHLYVCPLMP